LHPFKKKVIEFLQSQIPCRQRPVPQNPGSVLIVRQHDQLGDFLMSTPVFRELKRALPDCRISVVLTRYTKPVAENNPHIDEIIVYEKKVLRWERKGLNQFVKGIGQKFDLAMVLNTPSRSMTSDMIGVLSGAAFRLGMEPRPEGDAAKYDFMYHATSQREYPRINQSLENLSILKSLGIESDEAGQEMFLTDAEMAWAKARLSELGYDQPPLLILPGANKPANIWPVERYIELGLKLRGERPVLVLWGPGQDEIGEKLLAGLTDAGAKTVRKTSIREMAALAASSALAVCNDTGDLHICAAVGAQVLGLFGPTKPEMYIPLGDHVHRIQSSTDAMEGIGVDEGVGEVVRLFPPGGTPTGRQTP